ncbi:hypothetical protein AXF42_Ash005164 [Apostasia shenzhenica]|uniref:Uncharacterized protein n=1 Tax=Apostasia shenzhenica TaxID=1088818 RepID=A0A2I0B8S4_9ASPA|nr:hypothetical protein AXF42_Ash005164 [Apostasia shenzhenica]
MGRKALGRERNGRSVRGGLAGATNEGAAGAAGAPTGSRSGRADWSAGVGAQTGLARPDRVELRIHVVGAGTSSATLPLYSATDIGRLRLHRNNAPDFNDVP